jgi:hypothetical protein
MAMAVTTARPDRRVVQALMSGSRLRQLTYYLEITALSEWRHGKVGQASRGWSMSIFDDLWDWLFPVPPLRELLEPDSCGHHNVYAIELDDPALDDSRFREANPNYDGKSPCVYVGLTGLTPEERLEKHKEGYKSSRWVRLCGLGLIPGLCLHDVSSGLAHSRSVLQRYFTLFMAMYSKLV